MLATVGLYGVMAYSMTRRSREIGIRVTIGALHGHIVRMVLSDSARVTLAGTAAGLLAAVLVTKPLAMFLLPGLKPADPLNFAVVAVAMSCGLLDWQPPGAPFCAPLISSPTPHCATNDC